MPAFSYIAKRSDGSEARGFLEAVSIDAAREEIRKRGLLLEDVREAKPKPAPLPWSAGHPQSAVIKKDESSTSAYAPLHETLRVFAGWLLAWYGLVYALGFLEFSGKLPSLPFVHELFVSPLVLQFTFGTFLLLALSNVHRWLGGGALKGLILAIAYVALLAGFVVYG